MNLKIIHIGNFARREDGSIAAPAAYSQMFKALSGKFEKITVFSRAINEGQIGFEFINVENLPPSINYKLVKGNTPTTRLSEFIKNNLTALITSITFCREDTNYFIFLPSPVGAWATMLIHPAQKKNTTLGLYVGGHYGAEQQHEKRFGILKKLIKRLGARLIDNMVESAILKADYVITSSYKYFDQFKESGKIFLAPPLILVDEDDIKSSPPPLPETNDRNILFCGELRYAKGVMDLLKAFHLLTQEQQEYNYKLTIIGKGFARDELERFAKTSNIEALVDFKGQINDVSELKRQFTNSHMLAIPSYSEGFPRVAYECFTLGVPTLLTPVGGIPFLVKDDIHCLLVQPGNIRSITDGMIKLTQDTTLRKRLTTNARNLMNEQIFPRIKNDGPLAELITRLLKSAIHEQ